MFAEELGGNTTRRRQAEAKERRRKLKQQQERKSSRTTSTNSSTSTSSNTLLSKPLPPAPTVQASPTPDAVANAILQRELRAKVAKQKESATKIQAFFRCVRSNALLRDQQTVLLKKRLKDIATLANLLKKTKNTAYVPPPATTSAMLRQVLCITRAPFRNSSNRTNDLTPTRLEPSVGADFVNYCLIPGLACADPSLNPFLTWLAEDAQQWKLRTLFRILFALMASPAIQEDHVSVLTRFFSLLLAPSPEDCVPDKVSKWARALLLPKASRTNAPSALDYFVETTRDPKGAPYFWSPSAPMDLFVFVRFHLLFCCGGPTPIPTSVSLGEGCIPKRDKQVAHKIMDVLLDSILVEKDPSIYFVRVLQEIFTIPLLTWKLAPASLDRLISGGIFFYVLNAFVAKHREALTNGEIDTLLLKDIPLTKCPATASQCLLANLVMLGRSNKHLNGTSKQDIDYERAPIFYDMLALLVDAVPLSTFVTQESVVEWINDGKGHHSPVVLSPTIMNQCKLLLVDGFVRRLFDCAIRSDLLNVQSILASKNEKDIKLAQEVASVGSSATRIAAAEAKVDRTKGWLSSAWAKKLSKGVSKMIQGPTESVSKVETSGKKQGASSTPSDSTYSKRLLASITCLYSIFIARWGGGGCKDFVSQGGDKSTETMSGSDPFVLSLLNVLCFSTEVLTSSWALLQSDESFFSDVYAAIDSQKDSTHIRCQKIRPALDGSKKKTAGSSSGTAMLFIFASCLSHTLIVTDDTEIYEMDKPLPLHQLRRSVQIFKKILYRAYWLDWEAIQLNESASDPANYFGLSLIAISARAMKDLYDRSSRRPLCPPKTWTVDNLLEKEIRQCKTNSEYVQLLWIPILRICPFLVSFKRRLKLFDRIVHTDRVSVQGENSANPFHNNPLKPGIPVRIQRGRVLEDGLLTMNNLGRNMRQRIAVQYTNEAGMRESGVDVGGLFKEFWTDLCAIAFDPNYALFRVTEGAQGCVYPNPLSYAAHGADHVTLFGFVGRILGKALYEGITIHPQFAHFFLSFLRGDYNYFHMLPDLSTIDSQLYSNLMFLKTYDGDAEDLCLTFTVTVDDFGGNREVPLMPKGSEIPVTNSNKNRYIGLVAKFYVVDRLKEQAEAFTRGLWEVIDREWLQLFNEPELQVLISGATDGKIDVKDMRANTRYAGGFTGLDRTVNRFWSVVDKLDSKQQADLLRFVTSCERPPPLGFGSMNPPFTIQRVGILRDGDKLPASSTCFNTLKLPTYSSEKVMRERLLYAIQSNAGFELT